jgi:hypothetical protein
LHIDNGSVLTTWATAVRQAIARGDFAAVGVFADDLALAADAIAQTA